MFLRGLMVAGLLLGLGGRAQAGATFGYGAVYGYGVPVGCVILTDRALGGGGAVAMGPVGFDIGCGMMSARSNVMESRDWPGERNASEIFDA